MSYSTVVLSEPALGPRDHAPICNTTDLYGGGRALQGSPRTVRSWAVTCLTSDETEIDALEALFGQFLPLNVDGTLYPGVMIAPPFVSEQVSPIAWIYSINFIQETLSP